MSKNLIYRDIFFYILATAVTILMAYYEKITFASSIGLLILYFVLVFIVLFQDFFADPPKVQDDLIAELEDSKKEEMDLENN